MNKIRLRLFAEISNVYGANWKELLCNFMLFTEIPSVIKKPVRKLIQYITGNTKVSLKKNYFYKFYLIISTP